MKYRPKSKTGKYPSFCNCLERREMLGGGHIAGSSCYFEICVFQGSIFFFGSLSLPIFYTSVCGSDCNKFVKLKLSYQLNDLSTILTGHVVCGMIAASKTTLIWLQKLITALTREMHINRHVESGFEFETTLDKKIIQFNSLSNHSHQISEAFTKLKLVALHRYGNVALPVG